MRWTCLDLPVCSGSSATTPSCPHTPRLNPLAIPSPTVHASSNTSGWPRPGIGSPCGPSPAHSPVASGFPSPSLSIKRKPVPRLSGLYSQPPDHILSVPASPEQSDSPTGTPATHSRSVRERDRSPLVPLGVAKCASNTPMVQNRGQNRAYPVQSGSENATETRICPAWSRHELAELIHAPRQAEFPQVPEGL